jgi:glycosyltransferase involved in cell wall biosynthesis
MTPDYSLVVPIYNEAGNILPLVADAVVVLEARGRSFEIILVNDGSTDGSAAEIAEAARRWSQCSELRLARRGGQGPALLAGLRAARGELLLTMDGDGQNDPRDFPVLLAMVESGACDVACGWRVDRHDSWLRRALSRFAHAARQVIFHDGVHDAGCQLRVMRRGVREVLFPIDMVQSFVPAIAVAAGFRVGEHPVRHHARRHGHTKFPLSRLLWPPVVATVRVRLRLWFQPWPRR